MHLEGFFLIVEFEEEIIVIEVVSLNDQFVLASFGMLQKGKQNLIFIKLSLAHYKN